MSQELQDTICAIATPLGEGGVGILRISGEKAIEIASRVVRLRSGQSLSSVASHRLRRADLLHASVQPESPQTASTSQGALSDRTGLLDEALVVLMRAPRSYTGETVVEIHCHGGPLVLQLLCEALVRCGARIAEPGEFTKRAFLNGRLDLTQAEAVLDTIRAKTEAGLRIAQEQLRGSLSSEVNRLREALVRMLAHVEAGIDFVEEDITFIERSELVAGLGEAIRALSGLADTCREGRIFREGIKAAIVGRPNVGKSSLLNALLQTDRAIVSAVPGTTRDVVEEVLNIRGIPVRLLDTAGVRDARDSVEQEGVKRTRSSIEQADVLLMVVDGSRPLENEDRGLLDGTTGKMRVIVVNKSDLPPRADLGGLETRVPDGNQFVVVRVSAKTGEGLDDLRDRIRGIVLRPEFEPGEGAMVTRLRHLSAVNRAKAALTSCVESVAGGLSAEFLAVDLRAAVDALGEMTGAVSTDDILDRIFSEFCIGK